MILILSGGMSKIPGFNEYTGWNIPTRVFVTVCSVYLPFDFAVAIAAVYGFAGSWLKRYLGALSTLGAYSGVHLTSCRTTTAEAATGTTSLRFSGFTACGTPLRLISVAFLLEEFLFLRGEGECCPTIGTS